MQEIELKKIAEELNISQTTVSRALSGNGRVANKRAYSGISSGKWVCS